MCDLALQVPPFHTEMNLTCPFYFQQHLTLQIEFCRVEGSIVQVKNMPSDPMLSAAATMMIPKIFGTNSPSYGQMTMLCEFLSSCFCGITIDLSDSES